MIIGKGDIYSALKSTWCEMTPQAIFFASGVSNSQETDELKYEREINLLKLQPKNKHLVYFSTLSIYYADTTYTRFKRSMEEYVKLYFNSYTIVRIGNITWGKNTNTIINFIKNKLEIGEEFCVKNEYRYLVDKPEFLHWINMIPLNTKHEMNVTGKMILVKDIVELIKEKKL